MTERASRPDEPRSTAPEEPEAAIGGDARIAVDFDGVLFDQAPHVREAFRELFGIDIGPVDTWPANLSAHEPIQDHALTDEDIWAAFHAVHTQPDIHRSNLIDAHACQVLDRLRATGHEVLIVTARRLEARETTELFLEHHGIPHDGVVMGARRKLGYDVLLDDLPHHVTRAADDGSLGLLMDQPYNRGFATDGNPMRVHGWRHVRRVLDGDR